MLLAGFEIFFVIDADDFVHLFRQRLAFNGAGLSANGRNAEFAAQFDQRDNVLVHRLALGRIGIDMIAVGGQRRYPDAGLGQLVLDRGDGVIVQLVRVQAQFHAGEAFGFYKLQIGVGIVSQHAQAWFPARDSPALLRLSQGGSGRSGEQHSS